MLTVHILSFSFLKGLPADTTGRGGGYVFDCRAIENPGRLPEFANVTGKDSSVIEFLEQRDDVAPFLEHVFALADFHIRTFLERDFTDLSFWFGCSGGQHRSVYCAERLAAHVRESFPMVSIDLRHREQEKKRER